MIRNFFGRNAANGTVPLWKGGIDNGVGPNCGVASDADGSKQLCSGTNINIVPQYGRSASLFTGSAADIGADMNAAVLPNSGRTADYNCSDMDQSQSFIKHVNWNHPIIFVAQADMAKAQQFTDDTTQGVVSAVGVILGFSQAFIKLKSPVSQANNHSRFVKAAGAEIRPINLLPIFSCHECRPPSEAALKGKGQAFKKDVSNPDVRGGGAFVRQMSAHRGSRVSFHKFYVDSWYIPPYY